MIERNDEPLERSLPNSAESERAILGAILLDNSLIAQAMETLTPEDFYVPSNGRIFSAMISLFMQGSEINPILLAEVLRKDQKLDEAGGLTHIANLTYGLPHFSNLVHYMKVVTGKSMLRKLIKECNRVISDAIEEEDEPDVILEKAGKGVFGITLEHTTKTFSRIGVIAHSNLQKAHDIQAMGTAVTGLATGFTDMDALTLGLQRTDLIIVAGRPSMGKTAYAVQLSVHAAILEGAKVAYFSLEMSEEQIGNRVLCCLANVDSQRLRSGYLNTEEWDRLHNAEEILANAKLFIEDTPAITTLRIKAKCRRLIAEHGPLDMVVVDYIQLMGKNKDAKSYNREQEVSQDSKDLKTLGKELNCPVVALSQLSRAPENRSDHRPILSDLRESGSIEQDADLVQFVYREDRYKPADQTATLTHIAEIILAKQRNGPTGMAALRFNETTGRFDNLHQQH